MQISQYQNLRVCEEYCRFNDSDHLFDFEKDGPVRLSASVKSSRITFLSFLSCHANGANKRQRKKPAFHKLRSPKNPQYRTCEGLCHHQFRVGFKFLMLLTQLLQCGWPVCTMEEAQKIGHLSYFKHCDLNLVDMEVS